MSSVSNEQIELDCKTINKPLAIESGTSILPLSELGDRDFEVLSYLLVKSELEHSEDTYFDNISLMQGVAERGRDCELYKNSTVVGLIQCKKYKTRITKPQIIKEVIKFLLFSLSDSTILPDPNNFKYNFYVSNDLNGAAMELVSSFNIKIKDEISNNKVEKYTGDIIDEYESFKQYKNNIPLKEIEKLLKIITVKFQSGWDLTERILKKPNILSMFFNIKTIIDLESNEKMINKVLDNHGLKLLTDKDLIILKKRIENTKEDDRLNFGFVDFFGYSKDFFDFLQTDDKLKEILESSMKTQSLLDKYLMDFLQSKINELVFSEITMRLLVTHKVHQFSVSIAQPYLFQLLNKKIILKSLPYDVLLKVHSSFSKTKDELIDEISQILFKSSEEIMGCNHSNLVGDTELINLKLNIYKHMHEGLENIEDVKKIFLKDIKIIRPALDKIENIISSLIPEEKTIVIKDGSFFDKKEEIENMKKTLDKLQKK
jgi:hypothetical protein